MTRNMIDANQQLFEKLKYLLPQDYEYNNPKSKHWLKTTNDEKNWLKNVKFEQDETFKFGSSQQISLASLDENTYLICIELTPSLPDDDFQRIQTNSGFFCAAVVELNISPLLQKHIGFEIAQNIFTPDTEKSKTGTAHELIEILKFFPEISIFKIHEKSPFLNQPPNLSKIGLFVTANCTSLQSLKWSQTGLEITKVISATELDLFPHELILRALTERKWDNAFLEIYRCIEFLLSFPKINELKEKLKLENHPHEISEIIEYVLGWRPTEESSLQGLFKNLPPKLLENFKISFQIDSSDDSFDNKRAASLVYKLRNDCVHFRPIQKASTLRSKIKWETLLDTMLHAAQFCYDDQFISKSEELN